MNERTAAPTNKVTGTPAPGNVLQRACACGKHTGNGGECAECRQKREGTLQRAAVSPAAVNGVPPIVHDVLRSPGHPLDGGTRAFMEPRFGHDFSGVRVHTDSRAAESARAVNARAYTVGQHIAFDRGQYAPHTDSGRHLLSHELAHTVQQGGLQRSPAGGDLAVSSESDTSEREASAVADSVMQGSRPTISVRPSSLSLHRAPWGECPTGTKRKLNQPFGELLKQRNIRAGNKAAQTQKALAYTYHAAMAAEQIIAIHFKKRGKYAHTNSEPVVPVAEINANEEPIKYMINLAFEHFRSGPNRDKKQWTSGPTKPAPTEVRFVDPNALDEGTAATEAAFEKEAPRQGVQLKPDLVDFANSEVYDVTTIDEAQKKAEKIEGYVKLYEGIRASISEPNQKVKKWTAGKTLKPPAKLSYGLNGGESDPIKICFGRTDLGTYAGVIAYEVIDTSGAPGADAGAAGSLGEPYKLDIGRQAVTAYALPGPSETDLLNSGRANEAIAGSVPGVILKTLHRKKKGPDTIEAEIKTAGNSTTGHKSTVPIQTVGKKQQVVYTVNQKTRKLTLQKKIVNIPIEYKYLSKGAITKLEHSEEKGLSGEGHIKPSIPLLSNLLIRFAFAQDSLVVTLPKKKPNIPIPGVTVTQFDFALELLPEFKPSGTIAFTVGTGKRPLMDGCIRISADSEGFLAKAKVVAHIPGVDEATGEICYRRSTGWVGSFTITTSQIGFVQNASVTVTFTDKGLDLDGSMNIVLPGDNQHASLKVKKRSATSWVYSGRGTFKVPRLEPVDISFVYDGTNVTGKAKTGFTFKSLKGEIELVYEKGVVTGKAHLEINKSNGRVKGTLDVTLNKKGKFSGEGKVSYEIKPGLIAEAGIILDKDEQVTLDGFLKFPDYKLFDKHPAPPKRVNIFSFSKNIPVPFLSIGPLGLNAQIGAGLFMEYGIGPGMIKDGFIKAKVKPLEEDPDPEFELGGRISVPMFFSVTGYISGGLVLDVGIAEAGGKIIVSATAELGGEGGLKLWAKYSKGEFRAEVDVKLLVELLLTLCVSAYVWAEAGVWRFKVRTSKSWNLLDYPYKPNVKLGIAGLKKPITYSSKTGFEMPSFEDINWVYPSLDAPNALKSGIDAAGGNDDGPKPKPCPVIDEN